MGLTTCRNCSSAETKPGEDECFDCLGQTPPTLMDEMLEGGIYQPIYQTITVSPNNTFTYIPSGSLTVTNGTYIIPGTVWSTNGTTSFTVNTASVTSIGSDIFKP